MFFAAQGVRVDRCIYLSGRMVVVRVRVKNQKQVFLILMDKIPWT